MRNYKMCFENLFTKENHSGGSLVLRNDRIPFDLMLVVSERIRM